MPKWRSKILSISDCFQIFIYQKEKFAGERYHHPLLFIQQSLSILFSNRYMNVVQATLLP